MVALAAGKMRAPWRHPASLSPEQQNRYKWHLLLPEVGVEGQQNCSTQKSSCSSWRTGSPAALYLAAAGVGTIGIVDMDDVDELNLQRQILSQHRPWRPQGRFGKEDAHAVEP